MSVLTTSIQHWIGRSSNGNWERIKIKDIHIGKEEVANLYPQMAWSYIKRITNLHLNTVKTNQKAQKAYKILDQDTKVILYLFCIFVSVFIH